MPTEPRKSPNAAVKYTGVAFQMLAVIGVCVWIGRRLDQWQHTQTPWFTLALVLVGVIGSMYLIIREANDDAGKES